MTNIPDDDSAGNGGRHTPGPWFQSHRRNAEEMYSTQVYTADGETIATLHWYPHEYVNEHGQRVIGTYREANARLIAAAPELLEALEAAVECGMVPTSSAREGGAVRHARQAVVADMIRAAIAKARGHE